MDSNKKQYTGKAITLPEQIHLLKDRGLSVNNCLLAEQHLPYIGFYRFFSYVKPILDFKDPSFELALNLYIFDKKLRLLLIDAVEMIEVAFRVAMSETMSIRYTPHWYCDARYFYNTSHHIKFMSDVIQLADKGKHPLMKHYYYNYSEPEFPPSWMLIECLTFGTWSKVFHNLKNSSDKKEIAKRLGQPFKRLESWIISLIEVRNICAHHERLWNHNFHYPPKDSPSEKNQVGKLYQQIYIIIRLLNKIYPTSEWKLQLRTLLKEFEYFPLDQMGFRDDWESDPVWDL